MKQLIKILIQHFKKEFHFPSFLYVITFCALIFIFKDDVQSFKRSLTNQHDGIIRYFIVTLYNILIYNSLLIPVLLMKKKIKLIANTAFWIKSLFFLSLISLNFQKLLTHHLLISVEDSLERCYWILIINNTNELALLLVLLPIFKLLYDRKENSFYGLNRKNANLHLFVPIILIIVPLVSWAAFQADFREMYPTFKPWFFKSLFENNTWLATIFYELAHASNFVYTELLFRGLLVIGLATILGTEVLLPMAAFYLVYHFGKPSAEILSSFFGGYILGVFALHFKNIWGGSMLHIALALLMDIAALLYVFIDNAIH